MCASNNGRLHGTVKWFSRLRGYGFITANGIDYFAHYSRISGTGYRNLERDASVEFVARVGDKGLYADEIWPLR